MWALKPLRYLWLDLCSQATGGVDQIRDHADVRSLLAGANVSIVKAAIEQFDGGRGRNPCSPAAVASSQGDGYAWTGVVPPVGA
jgi:hypothetical protein